MSTPVLLLGAGIVFWGWQVDLLPVGIILAVLVEGARLVELRWDFSDRDQRRAADICMWLMVAVFAYVFFVSGKGGARVFLFISLLPVLVGPLVLLQVYGTRKGLNLAALSLLARKNQARGEQGEAGGGRQKIIDISYIYLAVCLLAAGAANNRTPWFYIILFGLVALAFWSGRNKRYPFYLLVILLICGGAGGYAGQYGLQRLQQIVEQKSLEWMGISAHGDRDPFQANTAIGSLGELKLSNRIVARVFPQKGAPPPEVLRNGCYNLFSGSKWYVSSRWARSLPAGHDGSWDLAGSAGSTGSTGSIGSAGNAGSGGSTASTGSPGSTGSTGSIGSIGRAEGPGKRLLGYKISTRLEAGEGLLALPVGTVRLAGLPAEKVELGLFSALRVSGAPRRLYPEVLVEAGADHDEPPVESDLQVPEQLSVVLQDIVSQNNLSRANPEESLRAVADYFAKNYTYSLVQEDAGARGARENGLEFFLTRSHAGHCEYFASATVLLARRLGLPARYVTGWAVSEYSGLERCYLVRSRHAHAWAMVYVDKRWVKLDTTPPDWLAAEQEQASFFRPLADFFSWCRYAAASWFDNKMPEIPAVAGWLALFSALLLCARFLRAKQRARPVSDAAGAQPVLRAKGSDSEFYKIEDFLTHDLVQGLPQDLTQDLRQDLRQDSRQDSRQGLTRDLTGNLRQDLRQDLRRGAPGRQVSETQGEWLERIGREREKDEHWRQLFCLLDLHYRYRFDPGCDMEACGRELRKLTRAWLDEAQTRRRVNK